MKIRLFSPIHFLMGLRPETRNVIQLGIGFFFVFLAFNSQGFIEQTVIDSVSSDGSMDKHAGYYSLAIIYFAFTFANFVAAPIVDVLGAKWAMCLGGVAYTAFQAGFLFLNQWYLYVTSAILGFGAAIIWTGQGTYLSKNCTEQTSGRNSAMLWAIAQASLAGGGLFLFIVFTESATTASKNIAKETVTTLYSVFTALSIVGVAILALLPAPPAYLSSNTPPPLSGGYKALLVSTFKLLPTRRMIMLAFVFAYTGIEQSFWMGIYPTCISFTQKLGENTNALLALNAITSGFGQIVAGGLFGILGSRSAHRIGRDAIVFLGTSIHLVVFVGVYINLPADSPLKKTDDISVIEPSVVLALICGFLLGFGDACWNTQIYALLVATFPNQSSQAFALYKFYQSALSCAAFFYGSVMQLQYHLGILVVTSLIAAVSFFTVEREARNKLSDPVPEERPSAAYDAPFDVKDS